MKKLLLPVLSVALAIGIAAPALAAAPCPPLPLGTVQVTHTGDAGPDAYFHTNVTGGGLDGNYEGWCIDRDTEITRGQTYEANVWCSYSTQAAALVEHPENWDLVNWILNQDLVGTPSGADGNYTYGDVQLAIWVLLEGPGVADPGNLEPFSGVRINVILTNAAAAEGFVPEPGDLVAVVLQPMLGAQASLITLEVPEEFEGLTPGYWKNHAESWLPTGFSPGQTLESVFDVPDSLGMDTTTLMQALNFGGGKGVTGGAQILFRAAVAALLNSAHPNLNYQMTTAEVITAVNGALASLDRDTMLTLAGQLDTYNNTEGDISQ